MIVSDNSETETIATTYSTRIMPVLPSDIRPVLASANIETNPKDTRHRQHIPKNSARRNHTYTQSPQQP